MTSGADPTKRKTDVTGIVHTFAAEAIDSARPAIFVVDDDEVSRNETANVLRQDGHSVETLGTASGFLQRRRRFGPACLVLDMQLPDMTGIEVQSRLLAAGDDIPIIFLSDVPDTPSAVTAIRQGAVDYLVKPVNPGVLTERVRFAVQQHRNRLKDMIQRRELTLRFARLTAREREVAALVAEGLPNREIAAHLGTAEKTIKHHRARVMLKLGVESVAQLVRLIDRIGTGSGR
jgi:FixJ family two-component response regulator